MPELVTLSLHSFRGVRDSASLLVEQLLKQYPCLSNGVMQVALFAMAKLPLPVSLAGWWQADNSAELHVRILNICA